MTRARPHATVPAMARVKIRYFVAKPGAAGEVYYWQPAASLRQLGWKPQRLPDDRRQAIDRAMALNAELDAWRTGTAGPDGTPAPLPTVEPRTLAWVIRHYKAQRFWQDLRRRTKRSYEQNIRFLEAWGGDKLVAAITAETVETLYSALRKRTPAKAAAVITMLRILLTNAVRQGVVPTNVAFNAGIKGAKPSGKIWPREAVRLFAEAADRLGWPSIGTAVIINQWLGQRENDILALPPDALRNGRVAVHQSKTGARVSIPATQAVTARIQDELARQAAKAAAKRAEGAVPLPPATLLLCETTGLPWGEHYFRHVFADIRTALAAEHPTIDHADGTPAQTSELLMMHLRHTAVTEMAVAGCTPAEITGFTGHSLATVNTILARYLVQTAQLADNAAAKRMAHDAQQVKA